MHADFLRIVRWAATNHVPSGQIFMGEFDAVQAGPNFTGANPADRARWLTDVRLEAEAAGFRWSLWNLNDPSSNGMTLVSVADPTKLDAATLTASGKKSIAVSGVSCPTPGKGVGRGISGVNTPAPSR